MRVLHVIGGGDTGGAMSHLLPLLSALTSAGHDVHLACLGGGGLAEEAERRGLPVTVLPMSGAHDPRVLAFLRRLLAGVTGTAAAGTRERWDIVHTHGMRANLPVRLVIERSSRGPCLLTTIHSDIRLDYDSPLLAQAYEVLDRGTVRRVDALVCVSESLRSLQIGRAHV